MENTIKNNYSGETEAELNTAELPAGRFDQILRSTKNFGQKAKRVVFNSGLGTVILTGAIALGMASDAQAQGTNNFTDPTTKLSKNSSNKSEAKYVTYNSYKDKGLTKIELDVYYQLADGTLVKLSYNKEEGYYELFIDDPMQPEAKQFNAGKDLDAANIRIVSSLNKRNKGTEELNEERRKAREIRDMIRQEAEKKSVAQKQIN